MLWITVLSVFGFVAGAPLDQQPEPCEVCHLLIGELQDYLTTDQSKSSIETYVRDICAKLPSNEKDACLQFTENYAGLILSKLNDDLKPELFCQNIAEICPAQPVKEVTSSGIQDYAGCEICELLVTYLDQILKDNTTAGTVNRTLYEICDAAPDSFKQTCYVLVPGIESMLQAGFDPKQACTLTNFCHNDTESKSCEMCKLVALSNRDDMMNNKILDTTCTNLCTTAYEPLRLFKTNIKPCEGQGSECNEVGCAACKVLIQGFDFLVGTNFTVETINSTMSNICNKMAGENTRDACLRTVPKIVELMKTGLPAEEACKVVGLCESDVTVRRISGKRKSAGNKMKQMVILNNNQKMKKERYCDDQHCCKTRVNPFPDDKVWTAPLERCCRRQIKDETPGCIVCKGIGTALNTILKNNITTASLNSSLQNICVNLPADSLKQACFGALPNLFKILKTGLNVTDLCLKTNLCADEGALFSPVILRKVRSVASPKSQFSLKCDICEFVIEELDKELDDNSTQETINSTVYGICAKLQGAFQDICLESAPQIVTTIEQGLNTDVVCAQIKLCNSSNYFNQVPEIQRKSKVSGDLKCDICKYVVTEADKRIGQNATIAKINQTVYELCEKLTGTLATFCKLAAPDIVKQLANGGDPEKVCEDIKLCTPSANYGETEKIKTDSNLQCDICKYLITEAEKRLTFNSTIQKINETMYNICSDLFGNLKKICYAATPQIVTALQGGEDPGKVCTKVKFCASIAVVRAMKIPTQITQPTKLSSNVQGVECDLCEFAIKEIDSILQRNATGKDINATVYDICNRLTGTLLDLCLNFAPQIVKILETGVDPEEACKAIKLCVSTDTYLTVEKPTKDRLQGVECDLCKLAVKELDSLIKRNASEKEINSTVYELCSDLPASFQSTCFDFAPKIVTILQAGLDPETACEFIKVCAATDNFFAVEKHMKTIMEIDLECDICEFAVQEADKYLADNSTAPVINSTIYSACGILSGTLQALCFSLAPNLVQTIEGGADPLTACQLFTLCASRGELLQPKEAMVHEYWEIDLECDICEFAVQEADKYLAENSTAPVINSTIYSACGLFPGTLQALCYGLAPNLVQTIEGGADPLTACQLFTLCASKGTLSQPQEKKVEKTLYTDVDLRCDACEFAVQELDKYLVENSTATFINSTIFGVCAAAPAFLQAPCYMVAPNVVSTIEGGADPLTACQFLTLCASRERVSRLISKVEGNLKSLECDVCEFAIQEVDKYLAENSTHTFINSSIYGGCGALPASLQVLCYGLAPEIVTTIESGFEPHAACQFVTLCDTKDSTLRFTSETELISNALTRVNDAECDLCEFAVKEIDTVLANNASAEKINATIYDICAALPESFKVLCFSIAPQVVSTLEAGLDPETVCTAIGVCTNMTIDFVVPQDNLLDCDTCHRGLNEIWYNVHLDYAKVEGLLHNLCDRLPSEYHSTCMSMVEEDNGVIFKKFIQSYSPVSMCEMAGCQDFGIKTKLNSLI